MCLIDEYVVLSVCSLVASDLSVVLWFWVIVLVLGWGYYWLVIYLDGVAGLVLDYNLDECNFDVLWVLACLLINL